MSPDFDNEPTFHDRQIAAKQNVSGQVECDSCPVLLTLMPSNYEARQTDRHSMMSMTVHHRGRRTGSISTGEGPSESARELAPYQDGRGCTQPARRSTRPIGRKLSQLVTPDWLLSRHAAVASTPPQLLSDQIATQSNGET